MATYIHRRYSQHGWIPSLVTRQQHSSGDRVHTDRAGTQPARFSQQGAIQCVPSVLCVPFFSHFWYRSCPRLPSQAYSFPSPSLPPCYRCTPSRFVPGMATCGPLGIGPTVKRATSGYREPGCLLPGLDFSGLLVTGALRAAFMAGMQGIGVPTVGFTAGLTTASDTAAWASMAGVGRADTSPITPRCCT